MRFAPNATTPRTRRCTRSSGSRDAAAERADDRAHAARRRCNVAADAAARRVPTRESPSYWLRGPGRKALYRCTRARPPRCCRNGTRCVAASCRLCRHNGIGYCRVDSLVRHALRRRRRIAAVGRARHAADLATGQRSGDRDRQSSDQRIGAAAPAAASCVTGRHPAEHRVLVVDSVDHHRAASKKYADVGAQTRTPLPRQPRATRAVRAAQRLSRTPTYASRDAMRRRLLREAIAAIDALEIALSARARRSRGGFCCCTAIARWSETEQRWIGWERKRGKLDAIRSRCSAEQQVRRRVHRPRRAISDPRRTRAYVLTLDSDTELPPGRAARSRRRSPRIR